ncbi:TOTE conflict system archaeo-eukaryotic primase domain-containing protein [Micromonospora ureilytica]|uniref:TOTE conflict system archaeo-eukaryotic primase domain-containing protein n=1 Tax=Micromonospora ureilytica TaxID=709868 RepID=UPI00399094B3
MGRSARWARVGGERSGSGCCDLRSHDRLFPNQGFLPEGGFGNLIAAPLQGRRRKDGLTTFLDLGTLEPYADQWAFLSTLDRLSLGDAEHCARQAKQAVTGADVATMSRPLPAVVHAEAGAGLSIDAGQLTLPDHPGTPSYRLLHVTIRITATARRTRLAIGAGTQDQVAIQRS